MGVYGCNSIKIASESWQPFNFRSVTFYFILLSLQAKIPSFGPAIDFVVVPVVVYL